MNEHSLLQADSAELERLGEDVWDALVEAGYDPAPAGSGCDGFDVLGDKAKPHEAAVILRLEGPMFACGTPGVRRDYFHRWEQALGSAGFTTRRREAHEEVPFVLYVTRALHALVLDLDLVDVSGARTNGGRRHPAHAELVQLNARTTKEGDAA